MGDETQGDLLEGIHDRDTQAPYAHSDQTTKPIRASKRARDTTEGTGNTPRQHSQSNATTGKLVRQADTPDNNTQELTTPITSCTMQGNITHRSQGMTKESKQTQHTDTQGVQTRSRASKRQRIYDQETRQALLPTEHGMQTRSKGTLQDFYQPIARQQQHNNKVVAPVQGTGKRTIRSRQTTIRQYVQTEVDTGQQPQQALYEDSDSDINSEST
eukprot:gene35722-46344_t